MHGDEETGKSVVAALRTRVLPVGMDLWLIPTVNPDGDAHNTRYNAHEVDLNRNFPTSWVKQGGGTRYYSGPSAASEPETRQVRDFLLAAQAVAHGLLPRAAQRGGHEHRARTRPSRRTWPPGRATRRRRSPAPRAATAP